MCHSPTSLSTEACFLPCPLWWCSLTSLLPHSPPCISWHLYVSTFGSGTLQPWLTHIICCSSPAPGYSVVGEKHTYTNQYMHILCASMYTYTNPISTFSGQIHYELIHSGYLKHLSLQYHSLLIINSFQNVGLVQQIFIYHLICVWYKGLGLLWIWYILYFQSTNNLKKKDGWSSRHGWSNH